MRRVIAMAIMAGCSLAGCSSLPSLDAFKPTPPTVQVQLDSVPPGADARTSLGPGCKTPCAVAVSAPDSGFSVAYTLNKVPAGDRPGAGRPYPRRFRQSGVDHARSQSGCRGTSAGRPSAEGRPQDAKAEKAKPAQGRRGPCGSAGAAANARPDHPLNACTAAEKVRIVCAAHHA